MTDEEKAPHVKSAEADKARYAAEGGSTKASKKADSGKPKTTNGYALFLKEMHPVVTKKSPDLAFGEIGKRISELWKSITPTEQEKYKAKVSERAASWMLCHVNISYGCCVDTHAGVIKQSFAPRCKLVSM